MRISRLLSLTGLAIAGAGARSSTPPPPSSSASPASSASSLGLPRRNYDSRDYYVLELDASTDPISVASSLGLVYDGCLGALSDHHIFSAPKADDDLVRTALRHRRRKRTDDGDGGAGSSTARDVLLDGVRMAKKQVLRKPWEKRGVLPPMHGPRALPPSLAPKRDDAVARQQESIMKDLGIHDPIFKEQWHLINTVEVGHDVNVQQVWRQGVTGQNTTVAIVDDGLDMYSDDLAPNYYADGSYDFNDHQPEPKPQLPDDHHGTRCAGEVSAARNNACGVGVAYDSRIAGLRILSKLITDADESLAMMYDMQHNQIYSCSWGPPDDGRSMDAPGVLIRRAMLKAVQEGRGGLGSVYVFASGNGAVNDDNCNFDGYTNSIYSITVGAVDRAGNHPAYSEKCSAQLVVTYSSGSGDAIHTTDVGKSNCYNGHGGTSAAAPLAAGIFALVLQVRPDVAWRDMQYLVLDTAVPINEETGEYQQTARGNKFSHTYGYGKIDSLAIVEAARTWEKVKPQAWFYSPWVHVNQPIPQGQEGLAVSFDVTPEMLQAANLGVVEHVTVTMNVEHTRRGDLSVDLVSPSKVISHIATARENDATPAGYVDWTFMSVAHWGEHGIGTWTIIIRDNIENEFSGTFTDWHLKLWGESIDPAKASLLPMPEDSDDTDHAMTATTTATGVTATLPAPTDGNATEVSPTATAAPSDHPQRPTKIQSGAGSDATGTADADTAVSSSAIPEHGPSFFSSLGNAKAWIYGAVGLIAIFCAGLGFYIWRARRGRSMQRDSYEFEPLNNDAEKSGRRRQRGGELYDAFAGGSDDEDMDGGLLSEDDEDDDEDERERGAGVGGSGNGGGGGGSERSLSRER